MCGINGVFHFNQEAVCFEQLTRMNQAILHRGPDDKGVFIENNCGLAQVRLSIIDLSSAGKQPMLSHDNNYVLVFNGEIYNYKSLRAQLDYPFVTQTDSEVLLAAYLKWGKGLLSHLEGMFAFAIYDRSKASLFVARDPLGVKPLYWIKTEDAFLFSSETRGLMASKAFTPTLRRELLGEYFQMGSIAGVNTLLEQVYTLPPGSYLECSENDFHIQSYTSFPSFTQKDLHYKEATQKVRDLFFASVEKRLESDVPFGAFLSGGIDSTAITAVMSELAHGQVNTFTVSFDESDFSEAQYARLVAEKYKTHHTEIRLQPAVFLEQLDAILSAYDHPGADGANTFIVSKATKEAGITMALSGIGGDELFAGYPVFSTLFPLARKTRFLPSFPAILSQNAIPFALHRKYKKGLDLLLAENHDIVSLYKKLRSLLSNSDLHYLCRSANNWSSSLALDPDLPPIGQLSVREWERYLGPVLLRDADQMSMAHALEVREPFLDYNLFSYVLSLPDAYKTGKNYPKSLLVDALGELLPKEIVHRKKMGFVLPWDMWMKNELASTVWEAIDFCGARDLIQKEHWRKAYTQFQKGSKAMHWNSFWALITLSVWIKKNNIS